MEGCDRRAHFMDRHVYTRVTGAGERRTRPGSTRIRVGRGYVWEHRGYAPRLFGVSGNTIERGFPGLDSTLNVQRWWLRHTP